MYWFNSFACGFRFWSNIFSVFRLWMVSKRPQCPPYESNVNFSPLSRGNGLIEITVLFSPSLSFCELNTRNREFISVW